MGAIHIWMMRTLKNPFQSPWLFTLNVRSKSCQIVTDRGHFNRLFHVADVFLTNIKYVLWKSEGTTDTSVSPSPHFGSAHEQLQEEKLSWRYVRPRRVTQFTKEKRNYLTRLWQSTTTESVTIICDFQNYCSIVNFSHLRMSRTDNDPSRTWVCTSMIMMFAAHVLVLIVIMTMYFSFTVSKEKSLRVLHSSVLQEVQWLKWKQILNFIVNYLCISTKSWLTVRLWDISDLRHNIRFRGPSNAYPSSDWHTRVDPCLNHDLSDIRKINQKLRSCLVVDEMRACCRTRLDILETDTTFEETTTPRLWRAWKVHPSTPLHKMIKVVSRARDE